MTYRGFLSYCRIDDKAANIIHRALDTYRTPKALAGTIGSFGVVPRTLHPIFRDRTDMSGGGQLSERIEKALSESDALIVLCSPAAAESHWVNEEVLSFQRLGRSDRIYPVIAPGLPNVRHIEAEFFPPALRGCGLIAADLRNIPLPGGARVGDGHRGGLLKITAGLLGVPLDELIQRERARSQTRAFGFIAASVVGLALTGSAIVASYNSVKDRQLSAERLELAREQEALAREQQELAAQNAERAASAEAERQRLEGEALARAFPGTSNVTFDLTRVGGLWEVMTMYNTGYGYNGSTRYMYICPSTNWTALYSAEGGPGSGPNALIHGACIRQDGDRLVFKTEEGWAFARYDETERTFTEANDNFNRDIYLERVNSDVVAACTGGWLAHERPPTVACD